MIAARKSLLFISLFALQISTGPACVTIAETEVDNAKGDNKESKKPGNNPTGGDASGPGATDPGEGKTTPEGNKPGNEKSDKPGSNEPGEPAAETDCDDGQVDDNCHALPDGTSIQFPSGVPMGNCKAGTRVCSEGKWGSCEGAIAPEAQDDCSKKNDDSDCDGVPNAGCDCVEGDTRECGESNVGACKLGEQRCIDGKWDTECIDAVLPKKEVCDGKGIDEDCDGKADTEDSDCECINDEKAYCERGGQKGDCKWGEKTCKDGKWGGCKQWAKKEDEVCGFRDAVKGVQWTGDENCNGNVDESPFGKPGPRGCERMMLDQDGDGYGKMGADLSDISETQVGRLATACLCPNRPDASKKEAEGWVRSNGRANQDCGDCRGMGGRDVYPGSNRTTAVSNRCLATLDWRVDSGLGDFDLNCDGRHTDPSNSDGSIAPLDCRKSGQFSCAPRGNGRLITRGGLQCGGTYEFGGCEAQVEWIEVDAYEGPDETGDDSPTTGGGDNTTTKPKKKKKKVFRGCLRRSTGRRHTIRCQ